MNNILHPLEGVERLTILSLSSGASIKTTNASSSFFKTPSQTVEVGEFLASNSMSIIPFGKATLTHRSKPESGGHTSSSNVGRASSAWKIFCARHRKNKYYFHSKVHTTKHRRTYNLAYLPSRNSSPPLTVTSANAKKRNTLFIFNCLK